MNSNSSSYFKKGGKNEIKALIDQIKNNKKYLSGVSDANVKVIEGVVSKYILLKHFHKSYMEYCSVYKAIQESLIDKMMKACKNNEHEQLKNQIVRNAIVLVQLYKYIENGERYSYSDYYLGKKENVKMGHSHIFGYTGFGLDDFLSRDKRKSTLIDDLRSALNAKSNDILIEKYFSGLNTWQSEATDELNNLKKSVDGIEIDNSLSHVTFDISGMQTFKQQTMILSPMIYVSDGGHTIPLDWSRREWKVYGEKATGKLRILNLNECEQKHKRVKINYDEGGIAESNLRTEIKRMMEENYMEVVRQSSAIKYKTETITGRKNLKKKPLAIQRRIKRRVILTMNWMYP